MPTRKFIYILGKSSRVERIFVSLQGFRSLG